MMTRFSSASEGHVVDGVMKWLSSRHTGHFRACSSALEVASPASRAVPPSRQSRMHARQKGWSHPLRMPNRRSPSRAFEVTSSKQMLHSTSADAAALASCALRRSVSSSISRGARTDPETRREDRGTSPSRSGQTRRTPRSPACGRGWIPKCAVSLASFDGTITTTTASWERVHAWVYRACVPGEPPRAARGLKKRRENAGRSILFAAFVDGRSSCLSRCLQVLVGLPAERHPLALIVVVSPIVSLTLFAFEVWTGVCAEPVEEVVLGGELRRRNSTSSFPSLKDCSCPARPRSPSPPPPSHPVGRRRGCARRRPCHAAPGAPEGRGLERAAAADVHPAHLRAERSPPGHESASARVHAPGGGGLRDRSRHAKVPDLGAGAEGRFWACSCTDRAGEGRRRRGRV